MGTLWDNYRVPETEADLAPKVSAWCALFRDVPRQEVEQAIYSLSADGGNFAPQIGQVYARLKERRGTQKALSAPAYDADYEAAVRTYALIAGIAPPPSGMTSTELYRWFCEARERVRGRMQPALTEGTE